MHSTFKSSLQICVSVLAIFVGLQGCTDEVGTTIDESVAIAATTTCSCTGTGINGPVTVACGDTTCGSDGNTYLCNAPGGTDSWTLQSAGCTPSSCTCSGTGANGPVTVACGATTCGTDSNTYTCTSPGGNNWVFTSAGCASCSCSGTGAAGPVTVACGGTTCGTDSNTYTCTSPGGNNWTYTASGCGSGPPPSCTCSGTGASGPVTPSCGATVCGTDNNTYLCNSPGGQNFTYQATGCSCLSACPAGNTCGTVWDNCGANISCGTCANTEVCQGNTCVTNTCTCSGTGLNGPVTVACGQTTCGTDTNTYLCNSPGGNNWTYASPGCP